MHKLYRSVKLEKMTDREEVDMIPEAMHEEVSAFVSGQEKLRLLLPTKIKC